jgi:copper(I)-binding protein
LRVITLGRPFAPSTRETSLRNTALLGNTAPRLLALAAAAVLVLAGCTTPAAEPSGQPTHGDHGDHDHGEAAVHIHDAWVKAVDEGMTAAFGELHNESDHELTVVSATSPATTMIELHEVVDGVMSPKDGGFTIPAGESITLEPGGWHIMFMDVVEPLTPGDEVEITLTFSDGETFTFTAVAKEFSGANEDYDSEMDMDHDADMDHEKYPAS